MKKTSSILIVDDDVGFREACGDVLVSEGYEILLAENGMEALRLVKEHAPDLVFLDMMMPAMDGLEFLDRLPRESGRPAQKVLANSGLDDFERPSLARGARAFLRKPVALDDLRIAVQAVLQGAWIDPTTLHGEVIPFHTSIDAGGHISYGAKAVSTTANRGNSALDGGF